MDKDASRVDQYRTIINVTKQIIHALSQLEIPTAQLDPVFLEILLRKIDRDGIEHWEVSSPKTVIPSLRLFLNYLESRIIVLSNTAQQPEFRVIKKKSSESRHNQRQNRNEKQPTNNKREAEPAPGSSNAKRFRNGDVQQENIPRPPDKCLMECNFQRPHNLWYCKKFRALDLDGRNKFIKQEKLCRRCVTLRHSIDVCKAPMCADCPDDPHNKILCPKFMVLARTNAARPKTRRGGRRGPNRFAKTE